MLKKNIVSLLCLLFSIQLYSLEVQKDSLARWYQGGFEEDSIYGINLNKAYRFLEKKKTKTITVAVLDSGIDIYHEDLSPNIWANSKEQLDGLDNDMNGYLDDIHGWNFLGGKEDTINVIRVGTEAFREYKRLRPLYEQVNEDSIIFFSKEQKEEYNYFQSVRRKAGIESYIKFTEYQYVLASAFRVIDSLMNDQYKNREIQIKDFNSLKVDSLFINEYEIVESKVFFLDSLTLWKPLCKSHYDDFLLSAKRVVSLDDPSSPRDIIGDDLLDINDRFYGNNNLRTDMDHGTFVAGIIAAIRDNQKGIDGIAQDVKIMPLRVVPEGDEYDKDIALAIRYAVNNGANIINMSFGKYLSPHSHWVDEAIEYATSKNILLVHAAGNSGVNIDEQLIYPTGMMTNGEKSNSFIRVGGSDQKGVPISISNYGKKEVDLFAPGQKIKSLIGDNKYQTSWGTSVAAPMVSGVAALIWSYYPKLKASQLKDILLDTVTKIDKPVKQPQKEEEVPFSDLCISGGILNAYNAVLKADSLSNN